RRDRREPDVPGRGGVAPRPRRGGGGASGRVLHRDDDGVHSRESAVVERGYWGMSRITITVDERVLAEVDRLVREGSFASRSLAIEVGVKEWLRHSRLAREAAKLDRAEEQALAEEGYAGEGEWPEY